MLPMCMCCVFNVCCVLHLWPWATIEIYLEVYSNSERAWCDTVEYLECF